MTASLFRSTSGQNAPGLLSTMPPVCIPKPELIRVQKAPGLLCPEGSRLHTPPGSVSPPRDTRAVTRSLSLAGWSIHCASAVLALQLPADGNAWTVLASAPPSAAVSASTVSLRGWQYVLFVPSPALSAEITPSASPDQK